jgi:ABC-type transport system involved in multi-copper enzyme maturation permease subunit
MRAFVPSRKSWLRFLASWREWYAVVSVLGCGAVLILFGDQLSLGSKVAGAVLLLLLLVIGLRRGWVRLFGPVFFYDLVRTARSSRSFLLRGIYASALLVMLFLGYSEWFAASPYQWLNVFSSENYIPPSQEAYFAEDFFTSFLVVQIGMVFLLTPVYTATAIADEKERRTLDFLLATDLRGREIVLGKLASRLAQLSLFILTGLPVLGFLQLLGGVDPNLVLVAFAGTALTMLSLASLGILNSAYCHRPRTAIFVTYLQAGAFLLLSYPVPGLQNGNLFAAWKILHIAASAGDLANTAPIVLRNYAVFHVFITFVCCAWAATRLRDWGCLLPSHSTEPPLLRVTTRDGTILLRRQPPIWPRQKRPPITGHPLLWKELHAASFLRLGDVGKTLFVLSTIAGIGLAFLSFFACLSLRPIADSIADPVNIWVRFVGSGVSTVLLVLIALRSAGVVSRERELQTLDAVLTLPQSDGTILWAKGWGSIYGVRLGWCLLAAIWGLAIVFQGLFPFCVVPLAACWLAHAALVAGIGVWFSLVSRTTLRATIYTILTIAGLYVGPFLLGGVSDLFWITFTSNPEPEWVENFRTFGISAPASLAVLAARWQDLHGQSALEIRAAMIGIGLTAAMAAAIWGLIWSRFGRSTGRMSENGAPRERNRNRVVDLMPPDKHVPSVEELDQVV